MDFYSVLFGRRKDLHHDLSQLHCVFLQKIHCLRVTSAFPSLIQGLVSYIYTGWPLTQLNAELRSRPLALPILSLYKYTILVYLGIVALCSSHCVW